MEIHSGRSHTLKRHVKQGTLRMVSLQRFSSLRVLHSGEHMLWCGRHLPDTVLLLRVSKMHHGVGVVMITGIPLWQTYAGQVRQCPGLGSTRESLLERIAPRLREERPRRNDTTQSQTCQHRTQKNNLGRKTLNQTKYSKIQGGTPPQKQHHHCLFSCIFDRNINW